VETTLDQQAMKKVWAVADSIISPLGRSSQENFQHITHGFSGIKPIFQRPGHEKVLAGLMEEDEEELVTGEMTRFEKICADAIADVIHISNVDPSKTLLILSTTKGNVELLEKNEADHPRLTLCATSHFLKEQFKFAADVVISNACISGVLAIITGKRFLEAGKYENALVVGADTLSEFIISGFQSLLALSNEPCRPFDENRKGINLGEGAGAILLTTSPDKFPELLPVQISGTGASNDANHISGPSRTGEELAIAITNAMRSAELDPEGIDFISAHGTATLYNDEMEAKAFNLAGLSDIPLHSLKGYYGHTLGAAGVIETIIGIHSLRKGILIPCLGFSTLGVSLPLNVIAHRQAKTLKTFIKTSSGFGGCNAAIVLKKQD
jgi:3-oxoacyl-[acyl-carrier-protein] synthase I